MLNGLSSYEKKILNIPNAQFFLSILQELAKILISFSIKHFERDPS